MSPEWDKDELSETSATLLGSLTSGLSISETHVSDREIGGTLSRLFGSLASLEMDFLITVSEVIKRSTTSDPRP